MHDTHRRSLLKGMLGFAAGSLLAPIARAAALAANRRSGTLEDVAHIVVLMQENRSFDHYFGHLSGVRGVHDRVPILTTEGRPVWYQPRMPPNQELLLPFHLSTQRSSAQCALDLDHSWYPTHGAIHGGRNDRWPEHKTDLTMGYYLREDLPFHYALADAFTICDHYFCSTPTQTHPNRFYLMTGMIDPQGTGGGPVLDNVDWVDRQFHPKAPQPFSWTTYPERLEAAGISWQVYQQGLSVTDVENGNYGTNVLMNFRNFVDAPQSSSLQHRGMSRRTLRQLREDVLANQLPQVSWLLPPAAYSEHPRWTPGYGATYIARILSALTANPEVWAKTVLLLMYDENDGYFDHIPPPQPPTPVLPGKSTVSCASEIHDRVTPYEPKQFQADQLPYGLGPRVPMLAISPWSCGGFVCSEVFDHTSVLRFIEARFGVHEPNITPWRRAVCGDLTSAFDFSRLAVRPSSLPKTRNYKAQADRSCQLEAPPIPSHSTDNDIGRQEPGARPARPLGYALAVDPLPSPTGKLRLAFLNTGTLGASFYVYREASAEIPRRYTVGAGHTLEDMWELPGTGSHHFTISGPNGFYRSYRCGSRGLSLCMRAWPLARTGALELELSHPGVETLQVALRDLAYGQPEQTFEVPPNYSLRRVIPLATSGHWYDFALRLARYPEQELRLAGHIETGQPGITDPAASRPQLSIP